MTSWFLSLIGRFASAPIPGIDHQWIAHCDECDRRTNGRDDFTLHASRGGYREGAIDHCFECGHEKPLKLPVNADVNAAVNSFYSHVKRYGTQNYHSGKAQ